MTFITTSLFDLFKIGPGPSSSHTIGPMVAAKKFIESLPSGDTFKRATRIEVHLFGSLSATGRGHGTGNAVALGLLGETPKSCDVEKLLSLFSNQERYELSIGPHKLFLEEKDILFDTVHHSYPYSNTMIFQLMEGNKVLFEKEYYSIGGGFVLCAGEEEKPRPVPPYPYRNFSELKHLLKTNELSLSDLLCHNEEVLTGRTKEEIYRDLQEILNVMEMAVEKGLNTHGFLPGPLRLERKASSLYRMAESNLLNIPDRFLVFLDVYSLAASEENAAGHRVVTAPTSGSAGVIPGLLYLLKHYYHMDSSHLIEGLFAAAAIGFIAKHNASISGAEVGCQGEVGVAASMGAALVAYIDGCSVDVIESAAETALEHMLGMSCDPIKGYVQIPCIERNAVGAVNAYNAYLLASSGDPKKQKISFDQVIDVMLKTGKDMSAKYKETSEGGLALCEILC